MKRIPQQTTVTSFQTVTIEEQTEIDGIESFYDVTVSVPVATGDDDAAATRAAIETVTDELSLSAPIEVASGPFVDGYLVQPSMYFTSTAENVPAGATDCDVYERQYLTLPDSDTHLKIHTLSIIPTSDAHDDTEIPFYSATETPTDNDYAALVYVVAGSDHEDVLDQIRATATDTDETADQRIFYTPLHRIAVADN